MELKLSDKVQSTLCCPICNSGLEKSADTYQCINIDCKAIFPIKDGIPILINESASIFSIQDFLESRNTYFDLSPKNKFIGIIKKLIPNIGLNIKAESNYHKFNQLLISQNPYPKVLVIGGSILGKGTSSIINNPDIDLVESDISFGTRTNLICDAHNIPFADNSFDGVIIQAVLEHVVDPWRCVEEIHRILTKDGLVYAETPFMQQVHGGCYDFTRFTYLGHRRLFRKFEEVDSGIACGPAMALAWSYKYFMLSFTKSKLLRMMIELFVRLTAFPLKYLDHILIKKSTALDAASGYYFIGKKSNYILSDKELIKLYQGT